MKKTTMKKTGNKILLFTIIIILISAIALAQNDPGHDTLYIEQQGDSQLNGTLNITNNMSIEGGRTYQSAGLTLYGNGYTSAPATGAYVSGLSSTHDLYLEGQGSIFIKYVSGGDTVYIGKAGITATDLNVSGALYIQSGTATIAGQAICLANGSNCPGGTNTGNVTSVSESGNGPLVISPTTGDVTISITIPTCAGTDKLTYNSTHFKCEADDNSGGTGDITSVQSENTYIYNGSDSGPVYLRFNQTLLNDTIDKRATAFSDGNNYTTAAGVTSNGLTKTIQIAIIGRPNVTASFTFTDTDTTYTNSTGIAISGTTISLAAGVITPGKYGNNTAVPVCTYDTYGRATTCTNTSISYPTGGNLSARGATAGYIPQFQNGTLLNNSIISQSGNTLTIGGNITATAFNISSSNGCLYLPGGGRLCGNSTCSTLYSPDGNTIMQACN